MRIDRSVYYRDIPIALFFVSLATVFDAFTFENINYFFIGASFLGMIILLSYHFKTFPRSKNDFIFFIFFYMLVVSLWNYESTRWTSLVYSGFFIITFTFFTPFIESYFTRTQFRKLLKIVFYMYFAGLLMGQLHISFDAFSPVTGIIGFMRGSFGTILEKDGLRYFSLSSEPSYAAFIVIVIFYIYFKLDPEKGSLLKGENLFLFLLLLYMVYMFKSAYGVMLLGLMLIEQVGFSSTLVVMFCFVIAALAFVYFNGTEVKAINRVLNVIQNFDFSQPHTLFAIDFTAYFRVAPVLHYFETADLTDVHFLFGNGAGTSRLFIVPEIYGGYTKGEFMGGFMPGFFFDFGVIGGLLVLLFTFRQIPSWFSFPTAVLALMMLNANFNTQLFWLMTLCFHLYGYYKQQETSHQDTSIDPQGDKLVLAGNQI